MSTKPRIEIDGSAFSTLEEFAKHFSAVALEDHQWQGNLNAFNDILRGGFGTPDGGFVLVWKNAALSRERLGYEETVRQLERQLKHCDVSNRAPMKKELASAQAGQGPTVFDWLVEIIRVHGEGGEESEDGVELELR